MQSKSQNFYFSELYREFRHLESRGLSINYSEIEQQLIAITHTSQQEQPLRQHSTGTYLKLLSNV